MTSTTDSDWKARSHVDSTWARTSNDEDVAVHLTKWMPLQNTTDLMYIMNWCPKMFVLYVLYCTVSKLHFGDSISPLGSFYCWDRPLEELKKTKNTKNKQTKKRKRKRKYRKSETVHTQRMLGPFNEDKRYPPIIYSKCCICWVMLFFLCF